MRLMAPARFALIPALSLSLCLTACQPPSASTPSPGPAAVTLSARDLVGRAVLAEPMVGATIKLVGLDGQVVQEFPNATNVNGAFVLVVPEGLSDFRVEAHPTAGAPEGQAGVLSAEVRGFSEANHSVYLNPVTTVVSHRLAQQPGTDLAKAEADAHVTFGLPEGTDLGADVDGSQYFDEAAFLQAAKSDGGFNAHVDKVAGTLGAPKPPLLGDFVVDALKGAAKSAAMDLGKSLAKKYADQPVIGYLLTKAFVTKEDQFRENVEKQLAEQNRKLDEINDRLVELKTDVAKVSNQLEAFAKETKKDFAKIDYNGAITPLVPTFTRIDTLYEDMQILLQLSPSADTQARITKWRGTVQNEMTTLVNTLFNAETVDVAGSTPAMTRWLQLTGVGTAGFPNLVEDAATFSKRLRMQREYFESAEVKGMIMIAEAYNDGTDNGAIEANTRYNTLMDKFNKQEAATYIPEVGADVLVSPRGGLMWSRKLIQPDAAKPDQYWFSFKRSPRGFTPYDPEQVLKAARIAGFSDWRLPTTLELGTLNPHHWDPVGGTGITAELMQNLKFDFAWDKFGWGLNKLWTSDVSGSGGVMMDMSIGRAIPAGSTDFVVLPVRSIPVYSGN